MEETTVYALLFEAVSIREAQFFLEAETQRDSLLILQGYLDALLNDLDNGGLV